MDHQTDLCEEREEHNETRRNAEKLVERMKCHADLLHDEGDEAMSLAILSDISKYQQNGQGEMPLPAKESHG